MFAEYKTRGPVILKGSDTAELIEKLEDSQMTLGSMATNRYSAPFRDEVQGWIIKLSTVSEIIEQWLMVQNMWMYMEAVFSGGDIVKQLPQASQAPPPSRRGQAGLGPVTRRLCSFTVVPGQAAKPPDGSVRSLVATGAL